MTRHRSKPVLLAIMLLGILPGLAQAAVNPPRVVLGLNVFDLSLDVDSTMDIAGETRFFSSRFNRYAGGRFAIHQGGNTGDGFFGGFFLGFLWGKSSFLLNWEEPGLISFEPLESSISHFTMPMGMEYNIKLGNVLTLSPYASLRMMVLNMVVKIGDEKFNGSSLKLGVDGGIKVTANLGKFNLAAGAGLTHILNEEIDFEVDDLTFASKTAGSSPEYFLGVEW